MLFTIQPVEYLTEIFQRFLFRNPGWKQSKRPGGRITPSRNQGVGGRQSVIRVLIQFGSHHSTGLTGMPAIRTP